MGAGEKSCYIVNSHPLHRSSSKMKVGSRSAHDHRWGCVMLCSLIVDVVVVVVVDSVAFTQ
jgi:t-SNARE complex subunit (syntaxin)